MWGGEGGGGGGGGAVGQLSNCHGERTFLYVGYKEDCYKHISNSLVWWGMVHVRSVALTSCLHGRVACRNDPCEFSIHVKLYVSNHTIPSKCCGFCPLHGTSFLYVHCCSYIFGVSAFPTSTKPTRNVCRIVQIASNSACKHVYIDMEGVLSTAVARFVPMVWANGIPLHLHVWEVVGACIDYCLHVIWTQLQKVRSA